ncbi:MAG TPA: lysoplasmalogenase [Patescibacteria group bacterium]|nr:lysoplasmalogenase [Patescibacteria group bacterium]
MAGAALAVTGLVAVADWVAVARSMRALEFAAKPAVMVGLIGTALALQPAGPAERSLFVIALGFGLVSDVLLMLPRDLFVWGLIAALVEHLAYISGFLTRTFHVGLFAVAGFIALAAALAVFPRIHRSIRATKPSLVAPVMAYVGVFIVMVACAGATGSGLTLAGALVFFCSDALLAWNRFVGPIRGGRLANIAVYHAGQAILVVSLVT